MPDLAGVVSLERLGADLTYVNLEAKAAVEYAEKVAFALLKEGLQARAQLRTCDWAPPLMGCSLSGELSRSQWLAPWPSGRDARHLPSAPSLAAKDRG